MDSDVGVTMQEIPDMREAPETQEAPDMREMPETQETPKPKIKSKRKKREPVTYETYMKILFLAVSLFTVSRVSVFSSVHPFGLSLMLALLICDRKHIILLPVGLLGLYSSTMNAYLAGADLLGMAASAAVCYFLGKNEFLTGGTPGRIRKNRQQLLLICALLIVAIKLFYHTVMDMILLYDVIMSMVEVAALLTVTFAFTHLYEIFRGAELPLLSSRAVQAIGRLWRQKSLLLTGLSFTIALTLFCAGVAGKEIMRLENAFLLGGVFLLTFGFWAGVHLFGDGSEALAEKIKSSLQKYSDIFEKLQHTYGRAIERKNPVDEDNRDEMVRGASSCVCAECSAYNDCWELYAGRARRYILDLARKCENKMDIAHSRLDEKYGFICKYKPLMHLYINESVHFFMEEYKWQKKIENSREAMVMQFRGITRSIYQILLELEADQTDNVRPIDVETGVCSSSKTGGVSGDSYICTPLSKNQYMIAISDGMGSGEKAAAESQLTVNMLYDFMRAGFDVELALNAMNSMLLIKSAEEIFSTVDLAIVDLERSRMRFYKIGAAMAFIKRNDAVTTIKQAAPPMGIIERIQVENMDLKVMKGDMLIMVSDGVTEADREDLEGLWLENAIRQIKSKNPQTVADLITKEASDRYDTRERDDMTVVVVAVR